MRRDMDLYRALLLKLEELPGNNLNLITLGEPDSVPAEVAVPGYSLDEIEYHFNQLALADLIVGQVQMSGGFEFRCLTPAGHDFLDAVRGNDNWSKTKDVAKKRAGGVLNSFLRLRRTS